MHSELFTVYSRKVLDSVLYFVAPCDIDADGKVSPKKGVVEMPLFAVADGMHRNFKTIYDKFSRDIGMAVMELYAGNDKINSAPIINGIVSKPTSDNTNN